jgi:translation machinery-associated protein 16
MPQALSKVRKRVGKKKGDSTSLHENSRDAKNIRRASARDDKVTKLAVARARINQPHRRLITSVFQCCIKLTTVVQRVAFFQGVGNATTSPLTIEECQRLVEAYVLFKCFTVS